MTQKLRPGLPGLRNVAFEVLKRAIRAGNERQGFRVVAFSVLSNHLHFVVEGGSTQAVSREMQGLAIRVAKALNRLWGRRGRVFLERFHARVARGMKRIRRALVYVLQNARRHRVRLAPGRPDPYSSAAWFPWRGWSAVPDEASPVVEIRDQWLTAVVLAWGVSLDDVPAAGSP